MNRLIQSVVIGSGAACVVGGGLFVFQQQQNLSKIDHPITISSEWGFKTKYYIAKASQSFDYQTKSKYYEQALNTLITPNTDLFTKSENWLAGYADLLRALGLIRLHDEPEKSLAALRSAATIPLGNDDLRIHAQLGLYELTNDPSILFDEGGSTPIKPPQTLGTESQIKTWAPLLLAQAKYKLNSEPHESFTEFLELHRRINDPNADSMCFKAQCGGYIAQLLWRLGRKRDSSKWLATSLKDVRCNTPSCVETRQILEHLMVKAVRSSPH